MITKHKVQYIAKLARLSLSEKEIKKHQKEFSKILNYIEKLKEVDISKSESISYPIEVKNMMRKDEAKKFAQYQTESSSAELMELALETKDGYFKVPSILK